MSESGAGVGPRESFASRFGLLMTMIGVAVGLGNVWRFPYMVGKFGGATFVIVYVLAVLLLGVPALTAEWALGRHTRRGPVGAFARAGLPFGRQAGWFFFCVVAAATAYYTNAVGWVLYHAVGELSGIVGVSWDASLVLPPDGGFRAGSFFLQILCTALVILASAFVLLKGLRSGIERASKFIMPVLLAIVILLVLRTLSLPGAWRGVQWYVLKFEPGALTGSVVMAALGQAFFSLSLGGTFMLVYGSYLGNGENLKRNATWTAGGDLMAGLLAGLALIPAVMALGLEPNSGPGLLFQTLPEVFARIPLGRIFGVLFYLGLFGAAYLSVVAAFEVLVAGITDNTRLERRRAVWLVAGIVYVLAVPPMINMRIFVPWDLTFGSGMQTAGSLLTVITVAWVIDRSKALEQLSSHRTTPLTLGLYYWLRFVVPGAIFTVGAWWFLTEVL